jgi:hypothetical protein
VTSTLRANRYGVTPRGAVTDDGNGDAAAAAVASAILGRGTYGGAITLGNTNRALPLSMLISDTYVNRITTRSPGLILPTLHTNDSAVSCSTNAACLRSLIAAVYSFFAVSFSLITPLCVTTPQIIMTQ